MMGNFGRKIWSKCIVQMVQQRKCIECPELRRLRDSDALQAKSFVIISRVSFLRDDEQQAIYNAHCPDNMQLLVKSFPTLLNREKICQKIFEFQ